MAPWLIESESPENTRSVSLDVCQGLREATARAFAELPLDVTVNVSSGRIVVHDAPVMPPGHLEHLLLDDVLPKSLSYEGYFVLHAAGLVHDGRALVILGDTGRGKSTLTASLGNSGLTILSDDSLVVTDTSDGPLVAGTYPGLRLLPDSMKALYETVPQTSDISSETPKRRLHLDAGFSSESTPIGALFVLEQPTDDITLRAMSASEACVRLIANSFALDPADRVRAAIRMNQASALANAVPAYSLSYPHDYARLPDVHRAIHDTLRSLGHFPLSTY